MEPRLRQHTSNNMAICRVPASPRRCPGDTVRIHGSNNPRCRNQYLGVSFLKSYDVSACAAKCNAAKGCIILSTSTLNAIHPRNPVAATRAVPILAVRRISNAPYLQDPSRPQVLPTKDNFATNFRLRSPVPMATQRRST
jgi:hypothetical protein